MACLNGEKSGYDQFDVENMQPDQRATSSSAVANKSSKGRRCCSVPVLLASAALLFSILALALGAYAAVVVRRPARSAGVATQTDEGVFLTANPKRVPPGWKAVNLYKASVATSVPMPDVCLQLLVWAVTGCASQSTVATDCTGRH
jgi:hypothetical protein